MPPLNQRDSHESELAAAIASAHQTAIHRILEAAGSNPTDDRLTDSFWSGIETLYADALKKPLEDIYLEAAAQMQSDFETEIDLKTDAETWAATYAKTLAAKLVAVRSEVVKEAIAQSKQNVGHHQDFIDAIMAAFSVINASGIAITETTTANSQAERDYAAKFAEIVGTALTPTVQNDYDPCDECKGKQGKSPFEVGFPPYHPYCRDYVSWVKAS